jgi:hypothetical protein
MHLGHYLDMLIRSERDLAAGLRAAGEAHADEPDVRFTAELCATWCDAHVERLAPFVARYVDDAPEPPAALHLDLFEGPREGPLGLLRDLHDLYLLATSCDLTWSLVGQAARAVRDADLRDTVAGCDGETARTLQWLKTYLRTAAPQALVVA